MTLYIGISGKLGSGKDYLSNQLAKIFTKKGYTIATRSFADGLKEEATQMLTFIRENPNLSAETFSKEFNLQAEETKLIYSELIRETANHQDSTGYTRTPEIRTILQRLGTDIRRKAHQNYWVEKLFHTVETAPEQYDIITIPDARFPNEMDSILKKGGIAIRLDVSEEILKQRRLTRDGIIPTDEQLNHPSETALDNYQHFTIKLGAEYDVTTVALLLLKGSTKLKTPPTTN